MSRFNIFLFVVFCFIGAIPLYAQQNQIPKQEISLTSLNDFKEPTSNWKIVGDIFYDLNKAGSGKTSGGSGILVNTPSQAANSNLFTNFTHGDIELEFEFMMDKASNSGVYLQGRYEVQLRDSWAVKNPKFSDCGGIYERWDESKPEGNKGYEGYAPALNVSKAPGLWQHMKVIFKAPRFNSQGEKTVNAVFTQVVHNGVIIHENVSVSGPTRAAAFQDEVASAPLMFQGDHGPVAIRNIKYKAYETDPVTLSELQIEAYEGDFQSIEDIKKVEPVKVMSIDVIDHQGSGTNDKFAGIISGQLEVPRSGDYIISLQLDWIPDDNKPDNPNGMGALEIDNKRVLYLDGKIGNATTRVRLGKGKHPLTLSYFKKFGYWYARSTDITLSIEGPGVPLTKLNKPLTAVEPVGAINVIADNQPVILRGFLNHQGEKKTHAISVGEPGSVNYALDLESGKFLQVWRGNFLETTPMWYGRGDTQLGIPLGNVIQFSGKPVLSSLKDRNQAWPESYSNYNYLGYDINQYGRPIFKYEIGTASVNENFYPEEEGKKLTHHLKVTGNNETGELWCKVAEGEKIIKLPNGLYAVNDKQYYIELPAKSKPVLRGSAQTGQELLLQLQNVKGVGEVKYSIVW